MKAISGLFGKTGIEIGAVNTALSRSLAIMGQPAYEFMDDPLYLVLSLLLLERITGQKAYLMLPRIKKFRYLLSLLSLLLDY